ncbi:rod shape-determining protein MreC [Pollutimonas harenae]|uniref:Cell shape-determining protein MreC n=1 Tax=Pollutimonas harenae TaxID=657015 RepID=A0A853GZ95_9BURK|nr:rod shape-determining protein MreC [Pollutimonas harenae]NYT85080.1 rod shape-determining protein MreC [Pollutimonas harenae]TEA72537.1 rod shape-determining protein MreC [Pollutimonas harenae]
MQESGTIKLFKRGPTAELRLFIFVLLALGLLIIDARWPVLNPARQAISVVIYPFQRAILAPRDAVERVRNWADAAAVAQKEKEALQRQRIELAQISTHAAQLATENEQLRRLLSVADAVLQPSVAVEVLYEPSNAFSHHLIFNKGSSSGILPGMPVIDEGGVVGQIVRVTPFTSEAALLTDDKVSIPVQALRNGLRLIAFGGTVPGKVEVRYLTADVDLVPGDTLITSGIGGLFPAGLSVAKIDRVDRDAASGFALAIASPLSHPERHRHFLVLRVDIPAQEQQEGDPHGSQAE